MNIIIERTIELNAPLLTEPLPGSLFTTEAQAHQFLIACTQNGAPVTLSGAVSAKFIREANNTTILMSGSISGGKASLILPADCYNISGRFDLTIFVTASNVTTCIYSATGSVKAAQDGTLVDEGTVVPSIEQLQQDVTNLQNNKVNRAGDTMTGRLYARGFTTMATNGYPNLYFNNSDDVTGYIVNEASNRRFLFNEYPSDSSTLYESYALPTPSTGLTATQYYSVLTTKHPVTVAQGGTGDTGTVDGPIAGTHANVTVSEVRLRRWGLVVSASGQITSTTALDALVTLFTLPVGFRSSTNTVVNTRIFNGSTGASLSAYTDKNGAFICRSAITANTPYYFEFSFIM